MRYVGLDVHKEFCQASVLDEKGIELGNERFPTTQGGLESFLERFDEASFVLESTGVWEFVYEIIEAKGFPVKLAHPLKVRAIAEASVKTDKVDARTLARLLRLDMVPESYVPPKDIRDLRRLTRLRSYLTQTNTGFKNRTHAELLSRGIKRPEDLSKPFSQKSQEWLRSLDIQAVDVQVNMIEAIQGQIELVNKYVQDEFDKRLEVRNLTSIPGVGMYSALVIFAEIGEVQRFPDAEHLCSYAGLTPTVSQSASTCYYGGISKEGSKQLRWILTEVVYSHHRFEPDSNLSKFFDKIARKKGKQKATMAAARKLLHIIYWMMLNGESYHSHGFNPVAKPAA